MSRSPALPELRAFVAVAQAQSFAAAAQALHLSQPALSRRIAKLEDGLGVRLFDRTSRHVELTSVGRQFCREVGALIEQLDRSLHDLRGIVDRAAGAVTIACVFSAVHHFLPAVIRSFRQRHPQVQVRIGEQGADEVLAAVLHGEADFGINYVGMQEPEVEFTPLLKEPYVLACRADHPLARRRELRWAELGAYDHLRVGASSRNRLFIDQALAELPPLPRPVCEVRHVSTLIGLVQAGLGIAVVPQLALPPQPGDVVGVALADPAVGRTIGLITRRGRTLAPAAQAFVDMLLAGKPRPRRAPRR